MVTLLLLLIFLRAIFAPLYLLAASLLAVLATLGLTVVIPLEQFRQMAIIMAVGVMVDTVVVRSLLVPGLVALFGRAGMWPGHQQIPEPLPTDRELSATG